ncbi:hypothetical protein [Propionicicella superfundia]|uniref:hypothetical protein n=1 Tax=Propionicicella superfundia TaxID=348582 RepID=UPI00041DB2E3|nr:hypothetical protein [Propionicicella superfundia]
MERHSAGPPEQDGLAHAGKLLRAALGSMEQAAETGRHALRAVSRECRRATARGADVAQIAVALGISRAFAASLCSADSTQTVELLGLQADARLRFLVDLQQDRSLEAAGYVGCTSAPGADLTLLWHRPDRSAVARVTAQAAAAGVAIAHEDFPAAPEQLAATIRVVTTELGAEAIHGSRLTPRGITIRTSPDTDARTLTDLDARLPAWMELAPDRES